MLDKLLRLDRRVIFMAVFVAVTIPLLVGFKLPIKPTPNVRSIYETIDGLTPNHDAVLISFDYGPSTATELGPMARALVRHCFSRDVRVVGVTLIAEGVGLGRDILNETAAEYGKVYGRDYAYLGFKAGNEVLILNMGQDFKSTFPVDTQGDQTADMEVTRNIGSLSDFAYVVDIAAGYPGVEEWIQFGQERYRFPFAAGCTAVMAPDFFPFLQSRQLRGLMAGLAGAAEYETLIGQPGPAVNGMRPQSVAHLVIIAFIVVGNIAYFVDRRKSAR